MFSRGEPEGIHDVLVSCASNLTGEGISQVFIALTQGMIVVLIDEGSKVRDRPTGDLSLYYWEHLKYIFGVQYVEGHGYLITCFFYWFDRR